MKFLALTLQLPTLISATLLTYDVAYDTPLNSLSATACSDGVNGLESKGYTTFGTLPRFPLIGGIEAVEGWNSPMCGTCWNITWRNNNMTLLAVDHAAKGFNVAITAMNVLTAGLAAKLGKIDVGAKQINASFCGL